MSDQQMKTAFKEALREDREAQEREPLRNLADVRALSVAEINERWGEVSSVMGGSTADVEDDE